MTRYSILTVVLAVSSLVAITVATSATDNNEGDNFQYMRARRGSKASEPKMSKEVKIDDLAKMYLSVASEDIKEKIKVLTKADEVKDIEGITATTMEYKKPDKATDFDLSHGKHYFIKIKAKLVTKKKEEEKYFHVRIFKGTHPDDYPRFVGIDNAKKGIRASKDKIEPFGMFKEFQPDPMKLPIVKL